MSKQFEARSRAAEDALQRFQNVVEELVGVLRNLAVLAAIDVHGVGRRYFAAGHVDRHRTLRAAPEHLYQIGSQSKTAVAMTLLRLHRAKVIDLESPVSRYLELPIDPRITVRHLLMNACGLGEMTYGMPPGRLDPRIRYAPRDLVALAFPQGQLFDPGSRFDYCNTGWTIAAMILEKACESPYGKVVHDLVLEPLHLKNTLFGGAAPQERMLRGYMTSPATAGAVDTSDCLSWAFGAGDGISTVDDLLDLFGSLCQDDSPTGITLAHLTESVAKPSDSPYFSLSLGTQYGLGIERRAWAGQEVWGHPGSTSSYLTGTWIDAKVGVSVTTCVTRSVTFPMSAETDLQYPRAQLFAMALNTGYALAASA